MIATLEQDDTTPTPVPEPADSDALTDGFRTELAHLCKMMADSNRLRIIFFLMREEELNVTEFCNRLEQSQPAVSHHLALLKQAGILKVRREGKHNFYSVCRERFQGVIVQLFESFLEPSADGQVRFNDFLLTHSGPTTEDRPVAAKPVATDTVAV